ncbi:hypothetical protein Q8F55_000714 [Vanrija albida]|uniref:Pentacotripeptide-repeat region of PRORP domain-containing protein n=1 Tax=Vanrija albida TaxID=181172 RepID=A0ABR3QE20_9TREE
MLTAATSRQGARLAPRLVAAVHPSFCQALPAESSRQAQDRLAPALLARRYSAAAALAVPMSHGHFVGSSSSSSVDPSPPRALPTVAAPKRPQAAPSAPAPDPDLDAPLTAGERFRRHMAKDPVAALLSLAGLSEAELETVDASALGTLLFKLNEAAAADPTLASTVRVEDVTAALSVVRALIHARPSVDNSTRDAFLGRALHGKILRAFLRACIRFNVSPLAVEVFAERMDDQLRSGRTIVDVDGFALDLASAREWNLAATIFSKPSPSLPSSLFTATVVTTAMTANLHLRRPAVTVGMFELLDPELATAETFNALTQAQLQLGRLDDARLAIQAAKACGISPEEQQVAILRGYRTLGYDADVEHRARRDLAKLGLSPTAPFLNALMRLRIDAGDLKGAEAILGEFHFNGTRSGVEPIGDTIVVALSIASRRGDLQRLHALWDSLAEHPTAVSDHAVAQLCRALGRLDLVDQACAVFESSIHHTPSPWPLPASFRPSIKTANVVLELATSTGEYDGLVRIAQLMREASIRPDAHTVKVVLEFARRNLASSPTTLAKLLREMLGRVSDAHASVDQLDVVLAEAVRTATHHGRRAQPTTYLEPPPSMEPSTDPTGGLEPRGKLKRLLNAVINSLREGGHQGTARSLANRILYDSLALDGARDIPPARQVWNALVLRGYRAEHTHLFALLNGYAQIGAMAQAEDVAALARESGVPTSRAMYNALIGGWARAGNLEHARALYDQAKRSPEFDVSTLSVMVRGYSANGQPDNAVAVAREDLAIVTPDLRCLGVVADAIRMAQDVPGAIFFLAGATELSVPDGGKGWKLDPDSRRLVRRCLNYLSKMETAERIDSRGREAIELGRAMLEYDKLRAGIHKPTLDKHNRHALTSHFDAPQRPNIAIREEAPEPPTQ